MPATIFSRARKALALSALALMVIYVVIYVTEEHPRFRASTRSVATSSTNTTVEDAPSHEIPTLARTFNTAATSLAQRCQLRGERLARPFGGDSLTNINNNPTNPHYWCTQGSYDKSCRNEQHMLCQPKGLLFVKTPKTGSTTISHIVKRIVHNVAQRSYASSRFSTSKPLVCQHREDHVTGAGRWYGNRVPHQSFLVASLRDPAQRAMSRFFWSYVTRHSPNGTEVPVDDAFILDYLNSSTSVASGCTSKGQGGYQLNYISMEPIEEWSAWNPFMPKRVLHPQTIEGIVNRTLQEYDFIILKERMEESLVILQFLLGLETGDIVSLSYNVGGSYRYEHGKCKQLIKSHTSPGMQEYFQSDEWYAKNYGDYLLFAAVNRSIDLTIEQIIGRERFGAALQEFRRLETKVNDVCSKRVPFPCSSNGTVLFHADQPIPHDKIALCIDDIVREDRQGDETIATGSSTEMKDNWQ